MLFYFSFEAEHEAEMRTLAVLFSWPRENIFGFRVGAEFEGGCRCHAAKGR